MGNYKHYENINLSQGSFPITYGVTHKFFFTISPSAVVKFLLKIPVFASLSASAAKSNQLLPVTDSILPKKFIKICEQFLKVILSYTETQKNVPY